MPIFSTRLRRVAPALRAHGYNVDFGRESNMQRTRFIELSRILDSTLDSVGQQPGQREVRNGRIGQHGQRFSSYNQGEGRSRGTGKGNEKDIEDRRKTPSSPSELSKDASEPRKQAGSGLDSSSENAVHTPSEMLSELPDDTMWPDECTDAVNHWREWKLTGDGSVYYCLKDECLPF